MLCGLSGWWVGLVVCGFLFPSGPGDAKTSLFLLTLHVFFNLLLVGRNVRG